MLGLFGSRFSDGRAASAPALRTGIGHESRALLTAEAQQPHVDLMGHDGRRYPRSDFEGMDVPDAFEHNVHMLPHEHDDLEERFPRAMAAEPQGDHDMDSEDLLEQEGVAIGMKIADE